MNPRWRPRCCTSVLMDVATHLRIAGEATRLPDRSWRRRFGAQASTYRRHYPGRIDQVREHRVGTGLPQLADRRTPGRDAEAAHLGDVAAAAASRTESAT